MNKLRNHWPERMSSNFGISRPSMNMPLINPHQKAVPQVAPPMTGPQQADGPIHYSFNIPLSSDLAGPNTEDILHATTDAVLRWTHPMDAPDDVPVYELPVHAQNLANLRELCKDVIQRTGGTVDAHIISAVPKNSRSQVVTVCLSGVPELVYQSRETILNQTPLTLRCTTVDVDGHLVANLSEGLLNRGVVEFLDDTSTSCGVDVFLLGPKLGPPAGGIDAEADLSLQGDSRWRVAIYGDTLSTEHAKTRVLVQIDRLLGRIVDSYELDYSLHPVACGRNRKNIKLIESATNTAIYFPPTFSTSFPYCPPTAQRRNIQSVLITGETPEAVDTAKRRLHEHLTRVRLFVKDVQISPPKIDSILLGRIDKVKKIMEANGTYVMMPPLGSRASAVRVQGVENLHVERTVRELMALVGQFYTASWWLTAPPADGQLPSFMDIRTMLGDICANSDADVISDKLGFTITGSDESVKEALNVISHIKFMTNSQYSIRVKIELANEHKEFVSGKKNGKINKIMGQSNVQIIFDTFQEYNFFIDVTATNYNHMKNGLHLVEQEMPASISFHVPDQYHKRIIGIGGQHIQRIMKKHSVFVKFSNAMDRGGMGREDDDSRVDNVICRTPARNAQNLDLVKNEILDMVDRADSEFTNSLVKVDRLYHRQLLARLPEIEELERKWNCKIVFPSTEQASDSVTVSGPEWQVPQCVDEFLGMVPSRHELVLEKTPGLIKFLESPEFVQNIVPKLKSQYEVELTVLQNPDTRTEKGGLAVTLVWSFTQNNAGGLGDAVDFLQTEFCTAGIELNPIKGAIPRPKSDPFQDSVEFFDTKLLQRAPVPAAVDSPTKPSFGDEAARERVTLFERLRKPGSMSSISSFLDRRKNSSNSTGPFFKGSNNVSKSSLISIESARSFNADRSPWHDSGVNLPEDENPWAPTRNFSGNGLDHKLAVPHAGEMTPRHATRQSADSGRPSTSHSTNSGYPGPLSGPFR
ncbi:hypothetical protein OQA88_11930 [Cercophora sp. LCS_1]